MDGSHAWLRWLGVLIIVTVVELVLDPNMEYILGFILVKLAFLACYLGAVTYGGICFLVNI